MNRTNVNYFVRNYHAMLEEISVIFPSEYLKLLQIARSTIVYTNFIEYIGPIISELSDLEHSCVGILWRDGPKIQTRELY